MTGRRTPLNSAQTFHGRYLAPGPTGTRTAPRRPLSARWRDSGQPGAPLRHRTGIPALNNAFHGPAARSSLSSNWICFPCPRFSPPWLPPKPGFFLPPIGTIGKGRSL